MEIYGSTQYVDINKQKEYFQLSVISQWDWKSKPICYQWLKSFGNKVLISYKLEKHKWVSENRGKLEVVEELTPEMKQCLLDQGYILPKEEPHD